MPVPCFVRTLRRSCPHSFQPGSQCKAVGDPKAIKQSDFDFKGGAAGLKPNGIALNPGCKAGVKSGTATTQLKNLVPYLYQLRFTVKNKLANAAEKSGAHVEVALDNKQADVRQFKSSNAETVYETHFVASSNVVSVTFSGSSKSCFEVHDVFLTQCKASTGGDCKKSCQGHTCDYWASEEDYTCVVLEKDYGCNCKGCDCAVDKKVCAKEKCNGKTCDEWVELGRSCDFLRTNFKCKCTACQCKEPKPVESCVILTGVFVSSKATGIELYTDCKVDNLGQYGLGSAKTGKSTLESFVFPQNKKVEKNTFLYVTNNKTEFRAFTAFEADYVST